MSRRFSIRTILLSAMLCFLLNRADAEDPYESYFLKKDSFESIIPQLRQEFGTNKKIPAEVETACLAALSFYPELKNTDIEFRFGRIPNTMISRPKLIGVFQLRENRKYVIIINKPGKDGCTLSWDELSFNALVGWIGHELGHVVYYTGKSVPAIIITGVRYLHPDFKRSMERQTDMTAIRHNMGFALYEGVHYTFCCSRASAGYKAGLKRNYLSLEEIVQHSTVRVHTIRIFHKKAGTDSNKDR